MLRQFSLLWFSYHIVIHFKIFSMLNSCFSLLLFASVGLPSVDWWWVKFDKRLFWTWLRSDEQLCSSIRTEFTTKMVMLNNGSRTILLFTPEVNHPSTQHLVMIDEWNYTFLSFQRITEISPINFALCTVQFIVRKPNHTVLNLAIQVSH